MLFTRDRNFYKTLFHLMMIVVFQNIIAYSINMADNLMLGMYSQSSLSGVATVNQIQFLLQQMTLAIGDTLVIIASQYWGQKKTKPIRTFTGIALATGLILGLIVFILTTLIFGKFGFPEMGTKGAAVGTLIARILELVIVVIYLIFADHKLKLFCKDFFHFTKEAFSRFFKILWPSFLSNTLWALATPIQTGILGRLSADAIAANSVSTTMFQYLKVITIGEASASAVLIGTTIGEGKGTTKVKEYSKTLQVIYLIIGSVLGFSLFFLRIPLLSLYDLTQNAYQMADQILIILSIVMVGMSYQMPTGIGIIKGGGDVKYMMYLNLISTWAIVMPLSFLGAFVWKLPVPMVVLLLNSDQLFKCIPTYLYVKKDKWIKVLV